MKNKKNNGKGPYSINMLKNFLGLNSEEENMPYKIDTVPQPGSVEYLLNGNAEEKNESGKRAGDLENRMMESIVTEKDLKPGQRYALVSWNKGTYLATVSDIDAGCDGNDSVLLSMMPYVLSEPLKQRILGEKPEIANLSANPYLNLENELNVLSLDQNRLDFMGKDQLQYEEAIESRVLELRKGYSGIGEKVYVHIDPTPVKVATLAENTSMPDYAEPVLVV